MRLTAIKVAAFLTTEYCRGALDHVLAGLDQVADRPEEEAKFDGSDSSKMRQQPDDEPWESSRVASETPAGASKEHGWWNSGGAWSKGDVDGSEMWSWWEYYSEMWPWREYYGSEESSWELSEADPGKGGDLRNSGDPWAKREAVWEQRDHGPQEWTPVFRN